jgi:hypothetical protein
MRALAAALVLGACFSPQAAKGVPCGENGACPSGQTCGLDNICGGSIVADDAPLGDAPSEGAGDDAPIDAMIDARIDAPAGAIDTDHDTVVDVADNCPTIANANQRDHDADGVGDVCDNCPHIANASQAATMDLDGVGDACDPDNARFDTLALFEGFYDPPAWTADPGWSHTNGRYVGASASGPSVTFLDMAFGPKVTVVAGAAVSTGGGPGGNANAGVLAKLVDNGHFYRCAIHASRAELARHENANFRRSIRHR